MRTSSKQTGVTLSELIITVSVVAILIGFSAPSYSKFITKRKVAGAANMISVFVETLKMESIKRNEFATLSYQMEDDGNSWCIGAVLGRDTPCDCMAEILECQIDSVPKVLSNLTFTDFNEVQASFTDGSITFDPIRGIMLDPSDSILMEVGHATENYQVNVSVNATGSVRKCTPTGHDLVGYASCI